MSEKNLDVSAMNSNNLTRRDIILLREYVELLNRRKDLVALLQKKRAVAVRVGNESVSGPDHDVNIQFAQSVINDLENKDSELNHQEQSLIEQMSEEGKKEAYAIRASISLYLSQPNSSGVM